MVGLGVGGGFSGRGGLEEREINEKEKEVLRSILIVYVFIQNGKAMQTNKITHNFGSIFRFMVGFL